jgi:hypothetical protein
MQIADRHNLDSGPGLNFGDIPMRPQVSFPSAVSLPSDASPIGSVNSLSGIFAHCISLIVLVAQD